jgi:hypothetical protein
MMKVTKYNVLEDFHNFWLTKFADNIPNVIVKASDKYPATSSCTTQSYKGSPIQVSFRKVQFKLVINSKVSLLKKYLHVCVSVNEKI